MTSGSGKSSGRPAARRRTLAFVLSLGAHLALLPLLMLAAPPPPVPSPEPVIVELIPPLAPRPAPQPGPDEAAGGGGSPADKADPAPEPPVEVEPVKTPPPLPRPVLPPPPLPPAPRPAASRPPTPRQPAPPAPFPSVGSGDLAGAAMAGGSGAGTGSGSGAGTGSGQASGAADGRGGDCDMPARLQRALRNAPGVRSALDRAGRDLGPGRTPLVWNGSWLKSPGEEGEGLAAVRQAIAVEVAFSPAECRRQTMRGLVLLTLSDAPRAPQLALGAASWRWSDLTGVSR